MSLSTERYVRLIRELEVTIMRFDKDVVSAAPCPPKLARTSEIAARFADEIVARKGYDPTALEVHA